MNNKAVNLEASPTRRPGILTQGQPGQLIVFNADDGKYFALDEIGSVVWEHCDGAHKVSDILRDLSEEYEAPLSIIQNDLAELILEFTSRGLLASGDLFHQRCGVETEIVRQDHVEPRQAPKGSGPTEIVGKTRPSGKIFFETRYMEDGRELEKTFYDEEGKVSKTIKYQHGAGEGYSVMEIYNAEGRLIMRHERGKRPQQFT
jgi:hypothetical protein